MDRQNISTITFLVPQAVPAEPLGAANFASQTAPPPPLRPGTTSLPYGTAPTLPPPPPSTYYYRPTPNYYVPPPAPPVSPPSLLDVRPGEKPKRDGGGGSSTRSLIIGGAALTAASAVVVALIQAWGQRKHGTISGVRRRR